MSLAKAPEPAVERVPSPVPRQRPRRGLFLLHSQPDPHWRPRHTRARRMLGPAMFVGAGIATGGLFNTTVGGTGTVAVNVVGRPVVLDCSQQPTFVDPQAAEGDAAAARIARMNPVEVGRRREGAESVRPLQSAGDEVPVVESILDQVQIDHTVMDLIVVDDRDRQPIGRPYLTVAIDVCSRCLVGMVVTLEPPSAVSVRTE